MTRRILVFRFCMWLCRIFTWLFLKAIYKDRSSNNHQWHTEIFNHNDIGEIPEGHYVVVKVELKPYVGRGDV